MSPSSSTGGESATGSNGSSSLESSEMLHSPKHLTGNDDNEDQKSVQSMLKMMMTKNESPPSLLSRYESGDDESTAVSAVSYDCIALDSLKNRIKVKKDRRKKDNERDVESAVESIGTYDAVSFSAMSRLTAWTRESQTTGKQKQKPCDDEEIMVVLGDCDEDSDSKTTGSNSTVKTVSNSASFHSRSSSFPDSPKLSRRFKSTVAIALCLGVLLMMGIGVLGIALHELKNGDGEQFSLFSADFWRVKVKNALTFWKEEEPGRKESSATIDGQE